MGYTHYWYRKPEIELELFRKIKRDMHKIIKYVQGKEFETECYGIREITIGDWSGERPFVKDPDGVYFNGQMTKEEDLSYESFCFPRKLKPAAWEKPDSSGRYYNFTKTARKPYDSVVCACLLVAKYHLVDEFEIDSDGNYDSDFGCIQGREFFKAVMGEEAYSKLSAYLVLTEDSLIA